MAHVAIVGAGITGITTAYALLSQGHTVVIVDRNRYPAMETSFANGGQLSASNAEVWNSWSTVLKGASWLFRADAPLSLNPRPGWHKYSWLGEFVGQIANYRANTVKTTRLAINAREHLYRVAELERIEFDLKRRGILHVYHNKSSFDKAARSNDLLIKGGLERYPVSSNDIPKIEPALQGNFFGGFYTPSDATGDIHKFTTGLAASCQAMGAQLMLGFDLGSVTVDDEGAYLRIRDCTGGDIESVRADAIVICAGVASRRLAATLGDRINIYPVKGYSITVQLRDHISQAAAPEVSLLDEDAKIVTSRLGVDRFRVAGTAEFNGHNTDIRADRVAPLVRWCERLFPGMSTQAVIPWAGLRPMTPSMLPRVGRGRRERVFYNTGHGHLGWTLSMATAELLAAAIGSNIKEQA